MHMQQQNNPINKLCRLTTPLMTLMTQIRHTEQQHNIVKLRAQIAEEIEQFQESALKEGYSQKTLLMARYCLCTAIDEAVLKQSWGKDSVWSEQTLLSLFHKETWGGERFYILLDHMAKNPKDNNDFLEFAYTLLSLGFEGKFYEQLLTVREEIRNRIFYRIRNARTKPDRQLCQHWHDQAIIESKTKNTTQLKRITVMSISLFMFSMIIFNSMTYSKANDVLKKLHTMATTSPVTTYLSVQEPKTLTETKKGH
ncbi:MAG: hypothetical protein A3F17_02745 [Gammaproteobacteria bacterium RIFCSPHIGHO2_12_FULL_41_15]|nr:MAG: hypothetical protein A3F17_02745 [Gammaproteobacteria bacterium RIFCSPHIGHO2_12_FULL_41_15]